MNSSKNENSIKGFALVEILIGSAIILIAVLALSTTFNTYIKYSQANQRNAEASYLLEETLEVLGFLRDTNWSSNLGKMSTTTLYYLSWSGNSWATTTSPQYVDGLFLRSFSISDVVRDGQGKISPSGTYDPDTKNVTATVSFFQGHATSTKSISVYLTNIYGN